MVSRTLCSVPSASFSTGEICAAAALMMRAWLMVRCPLFVRPGSQRPGVEDEGLLLAVQQDDVQHIQRVDGLDAFDQRAFAEAIQGLQGEATGVDLAAFGEELGDLVVEVQVPG